MKKIFFLAAFACISLFCEAQKITIDIDSIFENQISVVSKKWHTNDSVRIVTYKINGIVYGDSTQGNFNMTFEWKLDTTKAIKKVEAEILTKRQAERDQKEADLKRFYEKNPDLKPKAKLGFIGDIPKSYDTRSSGAVVTMPLASVKKRKWWQRKNQKG